MKTHRQLMIVALVVAILGLGASFLSSRPAVGDEDPRIYNLYLETRPLDQPNGPMGTFVEFEVASVETTDDFFEVLIDAQPPSAPVQPGVAQATSGPYGEYNALRIGGGGIEVSGFPSGTVFTAHLQIKDAQQGVVTTHAMSVTKP